MEEHAARVIAALGRAADVEARSALDVIRAITETAARTLSVGRVNVWLYDGDRTAITCIDDYDDELGEHTSGAVLRAATAPAYFAALEVLREVAAFDTTTDPRTKGLGRYLRAHRVSAMLDVPLLRSGHVVGVICHEHTGEPRVFEPWERGFAGAIGDLVSMALETERRVEAERERRHLEEEVERRDRIRSLGLLAAGAAHDFRSFLTIIRANVDRIRADGVDGGSIDAIDRASDRAEELCALLLTWSGQAPRDNRPVSLRPLVDELVRLVSVGLPDGVTLRVEAPPDLPDPEVDALQLRQVVLNLLSNAIESMPTKAGTVSVDLGADDGPRRPPTWDFRAEPGPSVRISVRDDGAGMTPGSSLRAFEPFYTTKERGTGFGLSTVLGVVRGHAGALDVRSRPGDGTTITVWLPVYSNPSRTT
ncbi:MAG: GAF domain-containing protein [Alphaproteobacteria bacterium]|nr:GAF domain-containing protein [Alphaproteobacteria bacterium]